METTTRLPESSAPCLLLAFELGQRTWKLGFSAGLGQRPRVRELAAGAVSQVGPEIARAKAQCGVSGEVAVLSCYEAGRDGFWLHRYLMAHRIANHVIDSSSIEVNRRARRAKTDRLDLGGLLNLLARYRLGDRRVWRVVRVPTVAEEDARHLPRGREAVVRDRTRLVNRLKGLLMSQGLRVRIDAHFPDALATARLWDGTAIPPGLRMRLLHEWTHLQEVQTHLHTLQVRQRAEVPDDVTATGAALSRLQLVRGVGATSAWVLATEIFGWRQIRNRRELAAIVGLVPTPYQSGDTHYEQGITRAGNTHVRRVIVELAWAWLRFQPQSALAQWYQQRFGDAHGRMRRVGIIALARKLLIALWRYAETGVLPDGAQLKPVGR